MSKIWLITGSSRGLGRDLASAVLAAGHRLVATARKLEDLYDLVARYGERVRATALDVTDPAAARAAVAVATSAFGRLDVVVNNAGYANVNSIEDMGEDDFRAQYGDKLLRRRERDARGPARAPSAAGRPHHLDLVHRRTPRDPGTVGLPIREVGGRRVLRGPVERGRSTRHSRDRRRAGRHADRLGGILDADGRDPERLPADHRRDDRVPPRECRRDARIVTSPGQRD
jgi:NAD(P)-dependent dehydrogenase (short-subunit alcohol dehydrogenase family)